MQKFFCSTLEPLKGMARLLSTSAFAALLAMAGTSSSQAADVSAVVGEENGSLDILDITTGTHTVINGDIGTQYHGLAFNADESVLYGVTAPSTLGASQLVVIDTTTGTDTLVGNDSGIGITAVTNLANGLLYGVDSEDSLYQINADTGAATLVGATGLPTLGSGFSNSLASNGTTLYYTLQTSGSASALYTINLTTGKATEVGATGTGGIIGSAFAGPTFGTGELYGFTTSGETDVINLTTGVATPLNSNGLDDIFGGVGIVTSATTPIPEPSTVTSLLLGGLGLLAFRHIRRRRA